MTQRPSSWTSVKLEELVSSSKTGLVRSAAQQGKDKAFPYLKMNNIDQYGKFNHDTIVFIDATPDEAKDNHLEDGDFIFNTRNSTELVGKCGIYRKPASFQKTQVLYNNNLLRIKFHSIDSRIVSYWLRSPFGQTQLNSIKSSTTSVAAIYQRDLMEVEIPFPPLSEQIRIAQKIDELMAQVDTLKSRIDAIPTLLKRFRQSVLAAATSGRLTEGWRIQHPQLVAQYTTVLLSSVTLKISDGEHLTPPMTESGVPLLSAKDVKTSSIEFDECRYVSREFANKALSRCNPTRNDILIVSRGATVGRTHRVRTDREFCLMGSVLLIRPNPESITPGYLEITFKSVDGQRQLIETSGSSAQQAIYIRDVKNFSLSLPSLEEQTEIVRRVEQLFAFADQLEAKVASAKTRIDHLTQSILAKAFRGELVPQDPNDEPASVLLERIKAQRAAAPKAKRGGKVSA